MHEPDAEGIYKELEQDLAKLHRPFPLDPDFVAGVEEKLLNRTTKLSGETKTKGASPWNRWIAGVFSTGRALAWGAAGILLLLAIVWGIQTSLPRPLPGGISSEQVRIPPGYRTSLLFARQDDLWILGIEADQPLERLTQGGLLNWYMNGKGRTFVMSAWYRPPQVSPDGHWIAFSRTGKDLFLLNLDNLILNEVPGIGAARFDWSPDSRQLALVPDHTETYRELLVYTLETGEAKVLLRLENSLLASNVVWSPDGEEIAFEVSDSELSQVRRIKVASGQVETVIEVAKRERSRSWPAESRLCWTAEGQVTLDFSGGVRCSKGPEIPDQVNRSPDGGFTSALAPAPGEGAGWMGPSQLTVRRTDTGEVVWQRGLIGNFKTVAWSPDGNWLFLDDARGDSPVWRMPSDGSADPEVWLEDAYLVGVFLQPVALKPASTPDTGIPTPALTPTAQTGALDLNTPHDEIRRLILNPTWQTLWIQGQASLFSPTGVQQNFYVQAWLEREGAGRVLSTGQIPGSLNFNLDMDPLWIWISDGETLSLFDVQAGRFDPSAADQQWFVHPLESAGQAMGMLFPSYLAVRSEDLEVIELGEQAGRPALVVDWAHFRLWVDAQTGVLLRQQTRDENGQVSQDIFLTAIAYELPLPQGVLNTDNLEGLRFEPAPVEVPHPILATPSPSLAPARIVFDAKVLDSTELFIMDEDGLSPIQLTHSGGINFDPACSPDGQLIAFTGIRDGQRDVFRIRPDGSEETRLTSSAWQEMYPAFSPDGQKIAYTALQADGNADIYVMNLDGSGSIRLTDHPAFDSAPAWSPDGTQIAFESERDGHWQIYLMNADGSGQTNLSNNRFMDHEPAWSPDGQKIAFHSDNRVFGGNEGIYVMTVDGSNVAALATETNSSSQRNMHTAWSPDGNWIAFTAYRNGTANGVVLKTPAYGSGQIGLHIALTPFTLKAANPCWLPVTYDLPGTQGQEQGDNFASPPTPAPNEAATGLGTGTVTGRIVTGYGDHFPAAGERVQVLGLEDMVQEVRTDENGSFTVTGLPVGWWNLVARHLSFQVTITQPGETVYLGLLKYPLGHPPPYYLQTPAAAPDLAVLDGQGGAVPFTVVASNQHWERPEEFVQQDRVWSTRPFSDMGEAFLRWWFRQPAVLYDTRDVFSQSFPGGLNLDPLGADWRYLLGLGTADDFLSQAEFYGPEQLNDLLAWRQVEIWLLGYQAKEVKRLGDHYLVKVGPAPGFQVIRFAGHAGTLQVHVVNGGTEIITLPQACRSPGQPDCDH